MLQKPRVTPTEAARGMHPEERRGSQLKQVVINTDPWNTEGLGREWTEGLFLRCSGSARGGATSALKSCTSGALRPSLPLELKGKASSKTIAPGTMYAGRL